MPTDRYEVTAGKGKKPNSGKPAWTAKLAAALKPHSWALRLEKMN